MDMVLADHGADHVLDVIQAVGCDGDVVVHFTRGNIQSPDRIKKGKNIRILPVDCGSCS